MSFLYRKLENSYEITEYLRSVGKAAANENKLPKRMWEHERSKRDRDREIYRDI